MPDRPAKKVLSRTEIELYASQILDLWATFESKVDMILRDFSDKSLRELAKAQSIPTVLRNRLEEKVKLEIEYRRRGPRQN